MRGLFGLFLALALESFASGLAGADQPGAAASGMQTIEIVLEGPTEAKVRG